jgi:RNA polymerase sigma-70 factor (ECF subfamily)
MRCIDPAQFQEWRGKGMKNLVKYARNGDADAFAELMQSQMQNMYKTAAAILHNDEDIADAVGDTLLACWEKIGQLKKAEFFRTWMTKILINKCNDILRRKRELYYDEEMQEFPEDVQEYSKIEWMEMMKCLDEKYRLVMVLYYVDGLSAVEISGMLDMPASTVRTRLARGRDQMASIYQIGEKRRAVNGGRV